MQSKFASSMPRATTTSCSSGSFWKRIITTSCLRCLCVTSSAAAFALRHDKGIPRRPWHSSSSSSSSTTRALSVSSTSSCTAAAAAAAAGCGSSSSSSTTTAVMQNLLYRIRDVNYMPNDVAQSLWTFSIDGVALGKVRPAMVQRLCNTAVTTDNNNEAVFVAHEATQTLSLNDKNVAPTCEARSAAVAKVMHVLRQQGIVRGWRDELYPIGPQFGQEPMLLVERAAVPCLGALEYGVHINGLVVVKNDKENANNGTTSETQMWMARRAANKSKFPNMVDHIVAGGQPVGLSLWENCLKECAEEAGIPTELAQQGLVPIGAVSYETYSPKSDTVTRAVLFNYDLHLPSDFVPTAVDGEVQEFFTWNVQQILASMAPDFADPLKPNCYLPVIDWLLRAGHISPDTPGYLDVLRELRSGDCR